jgi:hypothetical protein
MGPPSLSWWGKPNQEGSAKQALCRRAALGGDEARSAKPSG